MQDMLNSFGFLYHRFEPNLWWWELIEISNPNPNATPTPNPNPSPNPNPC